MNSSYLLLIAGVLACFVQTAYSIQCYQCGPRRDDPKCDKRNEIDCNHVAAPQYLLTVLQRTNWNPQQNWNSGTGLPNLIASGCLKKTYRTYEGEILTERGCFFGDVRNQTLGCLPDQTAHGQGYGIQQTCDVCVTDRCNSSTTILPQLTTVFAVLLMTFFGKLFIF